jgi:hypothetical protein
VKQSAYGIVVDISQHNYAPNPTENEAEKVKCKRPGKSSQRIGKAKANYPAVYPRHVFAVGIFGHLSSQYGHLIMAAY